MSSRGFRFTLGELVGKLDMLEAWCHRWDRRGRLSLARLLAEHGANTGLPELRDVLAGDCPGDPRAVRRLLSAAATLIPGKPAS
jgi:hypothetical protein